MAEVNPSCHTEMESMVPQNFGCAISGRELFFPGMPYFDMVF